MTDKKTVQKTAQADNKTAVPKSLGRGLKIARQVLSWMGIAVVIAVAAMFIAVAVQMFQGKQPSLFGHRFYYILTDSMSPELKPGDVILSKTLTEEEVINNIKVGDTITFIDKQGALSGETITHRVVKAAYFDNQLSTYMIITQGIKQGAPMDDPVQVSDVKAVMVARSAVMTGFYSLIRSPIGYVLLLLIPVIALIVILIVRLIIFEKKRKLHEQAECESQRIKRLKEQAVRDFLEERTSVIADKEASDDNQNPPK